MSIVCIKNHNENIYNITKKPPLPRQKSPRYVSKFKENIKSSTTCKDRATLKTHATMGVPQETLPDPSDYLKKHSGIKQMKVFNGNPTHKHLCSQLRKQKGFATKDEITSYNNHKAEEQQHRDNFIAKNIRAAVAMKPHDFNGDKVLKLHVKSKTFGKTPTYLERFVKAREKCYQARKDVVTALQKPSCVYIEKEERERLLNGLKQNWDELQKQYQGLPILTDTIPKRNTKVKLEEDLKQLEKDIVMLERHAFIYVYNDGNDK